MKYFSLIILLALIGCKGSRETVTDSPPNNTNAAQASNLEPHFCDEIVDAQKIDTEDQLNSTYIMHYELRDNCICIKYQYSGCNTGERLLLWDGKWNKSNNPEVMLQLKVRGAGLCEQLLTDSACFSIKKMQFVGNEVKVMVNEPANSLMLDFNYIKD